MGSHKLQSSKHKKIIKMSTAEAEMFAVVALSIKPSCIQKKNLALCNM